MDVAIIPVAVVFVLVVVAVVPPTPSDPLRTPVMEEEEVVEDMSIFPP